MVLVVIKALDILEYVARDSGRSFSLTEIAAGLNMNQATCVNILQTLVEKSYLEHLGRKKGYRLGPMAFSLTNNQSYSLNLITAAKTVMENLTHSLNETSLLGVIRNQKRFIVHLVNSDQDLQVRSHTERSVYETATGRLLLAYMNPKEYANFVASLGLPSAEVWPEADTAESLLAELAQMRADELSVTVSKSHIIGFAVPIWQNDQVVASLSVFLPQIRCSATRKKEIIQALRQASRQINQQLAA
ncbi:IclR family transcriptional regulator [Hymenobacter terrenus]|uniref:IclR family transcriptional regulator n=1 Tax=Hymenobacter terrenus TaxID=1629124 RepID=UPI00061967B3|nr:IclR family transcriptional regulator [Hymenobacter terrenus]